MSDIASVSNAFAAFDQGLADGILTSGAPTASASYAGTIMLKAGPNDRETLLGRLSADADFANATLSGNVTDFAHLKSGTNLTQLQGSIPLTKTSISGTGIQASMDGTVTGAVNRYTMITTLNGEVYDNGGSSVIAGPITGAMSVSSGGTAGGLTLDPTSRFLASE